MGSGSALPTLFGSDKAAVLTTKRLAADGQAHIKCIMLLYNAVATVEVCDTELTVVCSVIRLVTQVKR